MPVLLGSWITKSFPVLLSLNIFSIRFRPSGLMLKSVIHLELSFLQIKKYGFSIILLHLAIQFAQYPLLKMLPLLQCVFFFVFVKKKKKRNKRKNQVSAGMGTYVWVFNFILLTNVSVFVPISCCFFFIALQYKLKAKMVIAPEQFFCCLGLF